ncbi:MAG: hypothetical protein ABIQ55_12850 [Gemmatimonadaceae bacterium]
MKASRGTEPRLTLSIQAAQHGSRAVRAAVVDETKTEVLFLRDKSGKRARVEPRCLVDQAADKVYDRDTKSAARGYWAARIIRTGMGRGGSTLSESDYVLAKRSGKWLVIKIVGLSYSE